jgi:hypothetical protein
MARKLTTIEKFVRTYHPYHDISAGRATEQRKTLLAFEAHAGVPIEQADDAHLRAFLAKLVADGLHVNTVRKKRGMIVPFYGWCFDERLVSAEVLMRVTRVKPPRGATGGRFRARTSARRSDSSGPTSMRVGRASPTSVCAAGAKAGRAIAGCRTTA